MWHVWGRREIHTGVWWGNLKERAHLSDVGVDGRIILKQYFNKYFGRLWIGLMWLKIWTNVEQS
jgi:hypothetical protein